MIRAALLLSLLLALAPATASAASGTHVVGSQGRFLYLVGGLPQPIRGMGYNAILDKLDVRQRIALLQRDFDLMRRVGVNHIVGWDQPGIDRTFLDVAHAYGIGVVMHFELKKEWDYSDQALRARLLDEIGIWVDTHVDHPAVRMWGVGNEVMLVMSDEQCRAFASFWVEAYQRVRKHDTTHPVVYREAEDVRVPFFVEAFRAADPALRTPVAPPGMIFGMNFYTPRIEAALADFAEHGLDVPVFISEFAPAGVPPMQRAAGFRELWMRVQRHEALVLGLTPYVWSTEGPEAVDRIFGLTDKDGRPTDGSVAELQRLYRGANTRGELLPAPMPRQREALDMTLDAAIAAALARAVARTDLEPIDIPAVQAEARARYGADLGQAPGAARADSRRMTRMLDILAYTSTLAAFRQQGGPIYPGAVEALPLLAGMARWAAIDPKAEVVAEEFLGEVIAQALRAAARQ